MHNSIPRPTSLSRRVLASTLTATLALAALTQPATAQVRVAFGGPGSSPAAAISKPALARYEAILHLDEAQKQAAESLHEAYLATSKEASANLREQMEKIQSDVKDGDFSVAMEKIPALIEKHGEESGKVTRQFLDDLKSVLTPAQVEKDWPRLERYRRRAAWLRFGPVSGSAVDLIELVDRMKLPADLTGKLSDTLDQYELDIDRLLIEREKYETDDAKARKPRAGMMFDLEEMDKRTKRDREDAIRVREANQRYARQLSSLLPDADRAKLDEQFKAASFKSIYRETFTAKSLKAADKLADLTPEQRERINSIRESYARDLKAANDRWAAAQKRTEAEGKAHAFPVFTMGGDNDGTPADLRDARTARRTLDNNTGEQLAQVLTEEQRSQLPQRGQTSNATTGRMRQGVRMMAHDDGDGGGMMVVAAQVDEGDMIDEDDAEDPGVGNVMFHQVIVERRDETVTPPPPPPPQQSPPAPAPKPK